MIIGSGSWDKYLATFCFYNRPRRVLDNSFQIWYLKFMPFYYGLADVNYLFYIIMCFTRLHMAHTSCTVATFRLWLLKLEANKGEGIV